MRVGIVLAVIAAVSGCKGGSGVSDESGISHLVASVERSRDPGEHYLNVRCPR